MNADLHCHSTVSDGLLTPTEVVRRACANKVDLLALTDHELTLQRLLAFPIPPSPFGLAAGVTQLRLTVTFLTPL